MMTELTTKIGRFDPATRTVPVTFTSGDIVHERDVNAVIDASGKYDRKATSARVEDVARGVAEKISIGVITAPPIDENPETPDE